MSDAQEKTYVNSESDSKYKILFLQASDSIFILNFNFNILDLNENAEKVFGYHKITLIGKNFLELSPPHLIELNKKCFENLFEKNPVTFETLLMKNGGSLLDVEISIQKVKYHGDQVIQCFVKDIQQRKETENKLIRKNKELVIVNSMIQEIIKTLDIDKVLNKTLHKITELLEFPLGYICLYEENGKNIQAKPHCVTNLDFSCNCETLCNYFKEKIDIEKTKILETNDLKNKELLQLFSQNQIQTILLAPIHFKEVSIGFILLGSKNKISEVTNDDSYWVDLIANQIALAYENIKLFTKEQFELKKLSAINEITTTINKSLDLDEILNNVIDKTIELYNAEAVSIYLLDEQKGELNIIANRGLEEKYLEKIKTLKIGQGFAGKVAQTGKALIIPDFSKDKFIPYNFIKEKDFKSLIVIPLLSKNKIIGTINVAAKDANLLYSDIDTLHTIGNQIGIAIDNAKLFKTAQDRLKEINTIQKAQYEIITHINIDELLDRIIKQISQTINYDLITFLIGDNKNLIINKIYGDESLNKKWLNFAINIEESELLKEFAESKKPSIISDSSKYDNMSYIPMLSIFQSHAILPLMRGNNFIGFIILSKKEKNFYTLEQSPFLSNISNIASLAIEITRLFQESQIELRRLTSIDKIARAVTATFNLDDLFTTIYEQVCKFIPTDGFFIYTYDEKSKKITSALEVDIIEGKTTSFKNWTPTEMQSLHLKRFVALKQPEIILRKKGELVDKNFIPFGDINRRAASLLIVPLIFADEIIGIISAQSYEYNAFDNSHLEMLQSIARYAAIAIKHTKLYDEIQKRIADLTLIHSFTSKVISALDLKKVLNIIVKEITSSLNYSYCNIFLPYKNNKELYIAASYGYNEGVIEKLNRKHIFNLEQSPFKNGPVAQSFLKSKTIVISDVFKDSIYEPWQHVALQRGYKSIIKIPLKYGNVTYGVIALYTSEPHTFLESETQLLENLAAQAAIVIRSAKLYEEVEQFAHTIRSISDGVSITDLDGKIIFVNEGLLKQCGYTFDELIGKSANYYTSKNNPPDLEKSIIEATRLCGWEGEVINKRKNGKEYIINLKTSIVRDETLQPLAYAGVATDITEKKKLEKQLHDSELMYRGIVETAKEIIFRTDTNLNITFLNNAWNVITQYLTNECLNKNIVFFIHNEDKDNTNNMFKKCLSGYRINDFETRFISKNGTIKNTLISATMILDEWGEITGVQGIIADISERKNLEQQLIQAQKMESIGMLAGGIAHDFNNLLAGVLGYASFIKKQITPDDKFYKYIDIIEQSAHRASNLTQQLLAFARGGKYQVKPLNINRIVIETIKLLERSIDKSITIEIDLEEDIYTIKADSSQMQQILMNIFINARDAMPNGGVIKIKTENIIIDESFITKHLSAKYGKYIKISITDTGIGIPEENINKIFEPFFSTKAKDKGTGLGLSMVYGVVKNHNGFIDVRSKVNKGTQFDIYLPATTLQPEESQVIEIEARGGKETILLVDDEEIIRNLAKDILESKGYKIILAKDGLEAIEIFKTGKDKIDLVILDMIMPKLGGKETFRKLKEVHPPIKCILSSGYTKETIAREILKEGALGFVQKPFRINELASIVRTALDS